MPPQRALLLGDLEQAVMRRLWSGGPQDVKACHLAIGPSRRITHNTVQSTMERLYRKGLLRRDKVSHAYVYEAALSREEYGTQLARDIVAAAVGTAAPTSLLTAFVDLAERTGDEGLARLERLIAERRAVAKERA
jgi:predicted transcriptional regulator